MYYFLRLLNAKGQRPWHDAMLTIVNLTLNLTPNLTLTLTLNYFEPLKHTSRPSLISVPFRLPRGDGGRENRDDLSRAPGFLDPQNTIKEYKITLFYWGDFFLVGGEIQKEILPWVPKKVWAALH